MVADPDGVAVDHARRPLDDVTRLTDSPFRRARRWYREAESQGNGRIRDTAFALVCGLPLAAAVYLLLVGFLLLGEALVHPSSPVIDSETLPPVAADGERTILETVR
ncbi:MAG: hypothetical protein VYB54_07680 [Pseudomonadota bacterium]|nr:hypothetical protein [Pseudomonadota bacterium]